MRKVYAISYGCQMNTLDAELVRGDLSRSGYRHVSEMSGADVILINTCFRSRPRRGQGRSGACWAVPGR